jgi:NADH:ubiquinone reductase (H+-translocating)
MKKKVVILGGGFGGAYCAEKLEKYIDHDEVEIHLLDRNNYFIFYPLLVEAGTGSLEPRHAVVSIRNFLNDTIFTMAEVDDIDFEKREVHYRLPENDCVEKLCYDHVVISLGSVTSLPDIPGLKEFGFQLKSLSDAVMLRDRAIQLLEIADKTEDPAERVSLLHFIVVGGNFTGVEVAGEFEVFLKEASRFYDKIKHSDIKITLVEMMDRILNVLDVDLSEYTAEKLRSRNIDVKLNTTISIIDGDTVILDDGKKLQSKTVIWCAGISPNPLIKKLDLPIDKRGYILCEPDFRVKNFSNVWAIGDCALNVDTEGNIFPATAQHATTEALLAAKNIQLKLNGKNTIPGKLTSKGALAALGCRTAVAKAFGIKLSGFAAWFLWRTVYLTKMPGWSRKIRVALDWTMDLLFKRDYVQLGVHKVKEKETTSV